MGITVLTALIIQSRGQDIRANGYEEEDGGKFAGVIELWKGDVFDHVLISSIPMYKTEHEAVSEMRKIITSIREDGNLSKGTKKTT